MSVTIRLLSLCLVLWALPSAASTRVGVYAIIDEVGFEPADLEPDRIWISGVFVVPRPISSGLHDTPARGYLYFSLNPDSPQATRTDWAHLQRAAGTGRPVGFGKYWTSCASSRAFEFPDAEHSNCSLEVAVHAERAVTPQPYPAPSSEGVVTVFDADDDLCPRFGRSSAQILFELREAHSPGLVQPEPPVCPARIGLVSSSSLDDAFDAQGRDAEWAASAEASILRRFTRVPSLELSSLTVECRDTVCRIEAAFPSVAYRDEMGMGFVAEALDDLAGFSSGAKIAAPRAEPTLAYYIQRRRPVDARTP